MAIAGIAVSAFIASGCGSGPVTSVAPTDRPTELVCTVTRTWPPLTDLQAIRQEIERQVTMDQLTMIGFGENTIGIGLRARNECLARELQAAYGARLEITLGVLPFPPKALPGPPCQVGEQPVVAPPELRATPKLPAQVIQGEAPRGTVEFANVSLAPFDFETGSVFAAYIFRVGANQPIGAPEGAWVGTGLSISLAPGQSKEVALSGGTASCDPAVGYVLPLGHYEARARVDWSPSPPEGPPQMFWSVPTPIEVVAP